MNEEWRLEGKPGDMGPGEMFMDWIPFAISAPKSECVCRLTRAYVKEGKQWGTVALKFEYAYQPGGVVTGSVTLVGTLDAVIDGSAHDRTLTVRIDGEVSGGVLFTKFTIQAERTKTLKSVK